MSRESKLAVWLRARWLEAILLVGLVGLLIWYANVGLGFVPRPTPTPLPRTPTLMPTRALPTRTRMPTRVLLSTATPTPEAVGSQFDGVAAYQYVLAQGQDSASTGPMCSQASGAGVHYPTIVVENPR